MNKRPMYFISLTFGCRAYEWTIIELSVLSKHSKDFLTSDLSVFSFLFLCLFVPLRSVQVGECLKDNARNTDRKEKSE